MNVPKALGEIKRFGYLAGFYINRDKTKMLVKNMDKAKVEELQGQNGIRVEKKVKYLGVWVSAKNANLFEDNYVKVWKEVKRNLEKWGRLRLSFLGRISTIKMNVLPKMFLFQSIPITSNGGIFKSWQKDLTRFI